MGGHGGLNILPQKSWNVYGRDNRERVARDEAKHAEEQRAQQASEQQAERDRRRHTLLARARGEAALPEVAAAALPGGEESTAAARVEHRHFNFWQDDEAKAEGQDARAEAVKAQQTRQRGDPARQTSDARFDASFQVAHGLHSAASSAWYVQPTVMGSGEGREGQPQRHLGSISYIDFGSKSRASKDKREKSSKHKKEKKRSRREKHSRKDSERGGLCRRVSSGVAKKSVHQLREERVAREAVERRRALQAQVGRLQA